MSFTNNLESVRLSSTDSQENVLNPPVKSSWMGRMVELYCPQEVEGEELSCGQVLASISMWVASITLIVPLVAFLFAAIVDCCCLAAEDPEPSISLREKFSFEAITTVEVSDFLTEGVRMLTTPQKGKKSAVENPLCTQFKMSHKFSNDKALSYAVMVEYNTMVHNGTLNQSISRGLLNVWLQNRGLSKLPEKVSPTLLHVFQALYTLATTDETF